MHCDDKRLLFVFKQEIIACLEKFKDSNFQDESALKELGGFLLDYTNYKKLITQS